ncbi:MAG TPA: radical SAM protein [Chitinivibrionales bacterium]|nr:radical SAM protein [Chitinivibrionales bacterium]
MKRIQNVTGLGRSVFLLRLELAVFFHFLPSLVTGRISLPRFAAFLKRLLFFLSRLRHNKFARIGNAARIDLYVPGFPSRAFYTACEKFSVFGTKLPCATVLVSVTSACRYACPHCYQRRDKGADMPLPALVGVVRRLQDMGVAFFNVEGGEPFLVYDRLKSVCAAIDARSEVWVNSTGDGMTLDRLKELKGLNLTAIMFSLHTAQPEKLNRFMGSASAWENLERGVSLCHEAGVPVTFNACIPREDFFNGEFEKIMEKAREWNSGLIQLIKPKPAGARMEQGVETILPDDREAIRRKIHRYNHDAAYRSYPSISAQILEEAPEVFGCTAGGTDRFYLNAKGDVQPCEFLNISFGNVTREDFSSIYKRMRACFEKPGQTWLCEAYSAKIREVAGETGVLPLGTEESEKIYINWERGKATELYKVLE